YGVNVLPAIIVRPAPPARTINNPERSKFQRWRLTSAERYTASVHWLRHAIDRRPDGRLRADSAWPNQSPFPPTGQENLPGGTLDSFPDPRLDSGPVAQ